MPENFKPGENNTFRLKMVNAVERGRKRNSQEGDVEPGGPPQLSMATCQHYIVSCFAGVVYRYE
jgi:hypothetical protein